MSRNTSIQAYHSIKEGGLLTERRLEVYDILFHHGPMTGNQIVQHIGRIQDTGSTKTRLSELRTQGVVQELGIVEDPITGMNVILWDVTANMPLPFITKTLEGRIESIDRQIEKLLIKKTELSKKLEKQINNKHSMDEK